jgi:hypothetical protein
MNIIINKGYEFIKEQGTNHYAIDKIIKIINSK